HGLVLVDQHAAHERVLYNRLLERLRSGRGSSQPLLIPQAVDLEPASIAAAADHRAELANLGLEYEEFGPRSLRITAVPVELPSGRATAAIQETLGALAENRGDGAIEKAAAALACHSAVRFGDVLDVAEQRRLLAGLETAEESITCPALPPPRSTPPSTYKARVPRSTTSCRAVEGRSSKAERCSTSTRFATGSRSRGFRLTQSSGPSSSVSRPPRCASACWRSIPTLESTSTTPCASSAPSRSSRPPALLSAACARARRHRGARCVSG